MGSTTSQLVETEKLNWAKNHSLEIDINLRESQIQLLSNFGDRLHLCSQKRSLVGFAYYHYFITDNRWTIEFGVGDVMQNAIIIHNNPKGEYEVEKSMGKTAAMVERMRSLCGTRGYSLCLRNCEHMARYILSGSWVSTQTVTGSSISTKFCRYMMQEHKVMMNTMPIELEDVRTQRILYPNRRGFLTYTGSPPALCKSEEESFNIVIVGPTGCGKSRLINHLYNQTVCKSGGSATSITKHIQITSGMGIVNGRRRKVNVIDTIGFCDTTLNASEVQALIKNKVQENVLYVDRVVIVCSGRIEGIHIECLKKVMEWLRFDAYPHNFTFVYNKADLLGEAQREMNLAEMCSLLETGNFHLRDRDYSLKKLPSVVLSQRDVGEETFSHVTNLKLACGFPENAEYTAIEEDLHTLLDNTCLTLKGDRRIPAEPSWCAIL